MVGLNVCGLRSKLKNSIFEVFVKDYDVICLSETKVDFDDYVNYSIEGYSCIKKEILIKRHRYGGVHGLCMFLKEEYFKLTKVLNDLSSPYVLWVKFEKEAFGITCVIGSVYLPCETSKYKDNDMFNVIYDDITNIISKYNIPVCLIGDFNSRTGELDDYLFIESEIINFCNLNDIANDIFPLNFLYENPNISNKRCNEDKITNNNGEMLIEMCKALNLKIVNGRIGKDKGLGALTFGNRSTIDYAIVSSDLLKYVSNFEVKFFDKDLSDSHCPIILHLKVQKIERIASVYEEPLTSDVSFNPMYSKWDPGRSQEYQSNFEVDSFENLINKLTLLETE